MALPEGTESEERRRPHDHRLDDRQSRRKRKNKSEGDKTTQNDGVHPTHKRARFPGEKERKIRLRATVDLSQTTEKRKASLATPSPSQSSNSPSIILLQIPKKDKSFFVVGSSARSIAMVSSTSLQAIHHFPCCHRGTITDIQFFNANEKLFLSSGRDGVLSLWDIRLQSRKARCPKTTPSSRVMSFSLVEAHDREVCRKNELICLKKKSTRNQFRHAEPTKKRGPQNVIRGGIPGEVDDLDHEAESCSINCRDQIAAGSLGSRIFLYDIRHTSSHLSSVATSSSASSASFSSPCRLQRASSAPMRHFGSVSLHSQCVNVVRFHPSLSSIIFSGGDDETLVVSDCEKLTCQSAKTGRDTLSFGDIAEDVGKCRSDDFDSASRDAAFKLFGGDGQCVASDQSNADTHTGSEGEDSADEDDSDDEDQAELLACAPMEDNLKNFIFAPLKEKTRPETEWIETNKANINEEGFVYTLSMTEEASLWYLTAKRRRAMGNIRNENWKIGSPHNIATNENEDADFHDDEWDFERIAYWKNARSEQYLSKGGDNFGYFVDGCFDDTSGRLYTLTGAVDGSLFLCHVNLDGIVPISHCVGSTSSIQGGGFVRSACFVRLTGDVGDNRLTDARFFTGGDDGIVRFWQLDESSIGTHTECP